MHLLLDDATPPAVTASRPWSGRIAWVVAAAATLSVAALAFVHFGEARAEGPLIRTTILAPENANFDFTLGRGLPALSPDGTRLVFGARTLDGRAPLWVRSLDGLTAQPLAGTEGATFPFWSPDGGFIAFFADGKLKKIAVSGGPALTLADAPDGRGGSWSREGVIVFAPSFSAGPLLRVSSAGGATRPVSGESGSFPWFLPDGRHFLYQEQQGSDSESLPIRLGSLDGSPSVVVGTGTNAVYTSGHLLFLQSNTLMAHPFDLEHLVTTGEAAPVAERVQSVLGSGRVGVFAASETGLLLYREASAALAALTWFDCGGCRGRRLVTLRGKICLHCHRIRSELRRSYRIGEARTSGSTIPPPGFAPVSPSMPRATLTRSGHLTAEVSCSARTGKEDSISTARRWTVSTRRSCSSQTTSTKSRPVGRSTTNGSCTTESDSTGKTARDVWALPMMPARPSVVLRPSPVLQTASNEFNARFSPDGRWILFASIESQRVEILRRAVSDASGELWRQAAGVLGWRPRCSLGARWP